MRIRSAIGALLLAGAAAAGSAAGSATLRAAEPGEALYNAKCSMCHQAGGIGAPGQYPPLKNRIDKIASSPEGKHYLSDLLLYGMIGRIQAGGASYVGYMPSFKQLPDADIATILSWLSSKGDTRPAPVFTADDIAAARAKPIASPDVGKERKSLAQIHPLP